MGSAASKDAVKAVRDWAMSTAQSSSSPSRAVEAFGMLVFNDEEQRARLSKDDYRSLRQTITGGQPTLDEIYASL